MERKSIGSFIAALRRANGMTQQELADKLRVSNKAVSRWERDETLPDLTLIPAIAEIFGVTCDEILRGEPRAAYTPVITTPDEASDDGGEAETAPQERRAAFRGERRAAAILERELSKFRILTAVAAALVIIGVGAMFLVGMFYQGGVTLIGMTVMGIIDVIAAAVEAVAVMRLRGSCGDGLTEAAERTVVRWSYAVFAAIIMVGALPWATSSMALMPPLTDTVSIITYTASAYLPVVICAGALYLCYGPYSRMLTRKKAPGCEPETRRFRIRCMAIMAAVLLLYLAHDFIFFAFHSVEWASDIVTIVINIAVTVGYIAVAANCVAFIVRAPGGRVPAVTEAVRALLFSLGAGLLATSVAITIIDNGVNLQVYTYLVPEQFAVGALLVTVTAVTTTAIMRRMSERTGERQ